MGNKDREREGENWCLSLCQTRLGRHTQCQYHKVFLDNGPQGAPDNCTTCSREEVPEGEEAPGVTGDQEVPHEDHVIEALTEVLLCDESRVDRVEMETRRSQLALDILFTDTHTHRGERGETSEE